MLNFSHFMRSSRCKCSMHYGAFDPNIIKYTVDHLKNLKSIIVYASSPDKKKVCEIFKYAIDSGIEVRIPDNMLQSRNRLKGGGDFDGSN